MMALHTPIVHQNGSSADHLREPLDDLYELLQQAYKATRECSPNRRDYYLYRDANAAFSAAVERVHGWQKSLARIMQEIDDDIEAIEEQRP